MNARQEILWERMNDPMMMKLDELMFHLTLFPRTADELDELTGRDDFCRFAALAQLDQEQPLDLTADVVSVLLAEYVGACRNVVHAEKVTEYDRLATKHFKSVFFREATLDERRESCEMMENNRLAPNRFKSAFFHEATLDERREFCEGLVNGIKLEILRANAAGQA